MRGRKRSSQGKQPVKRLLDGLSTKKSTKSKVVVRKLVDDDYETASDHSHKEVVTSSSSILKQYEEVKNVKSASPDPSLLSQQTAIGEQAQPSGTDLPLASANSQFFYTPLYRRYFGLTPPNPRLCNPRLLEDYIDWYIYVYMEEELPWQWIDVGNPTERVQRGDQEAREEANKLATTSTTTKKH